MKVEIRRPFDVEQVEWYSSLAKINDLELRK